MIRIEDIKPAPPADRLTANSAPSAKKPHPYFSTDERRAYMRDLMRKRRAAAKAPK
jgi:hypothetical protein